MYTHFIGYYKKNAKLYGLIRPRLILNSALNLIVNNFYINKLPKW